MKGVNKLDCKKCIMDKIDKMEKEIVDMIVAPYTDFAKERNKTVNEVLQIIYKYKRKIYEQS